MEFVMRIHNENSEIQYFDVNLVLIHKGNSVQYTMRIHTD